MLREYDKVSLILRILRKCAKCWEIVLNTVKFWKKLPNNDKWVKCDRSWESINKCAKSWINMRKYNKVIIIKDEKVIKVWESMRCLKKYEKVC